jgi:Tfp pilus assembly pilus retraction ATPase PilT
MARLDAFLQLGCAQGCSDIHLAMGVPPMLRLYGDLLPVKYRVWMPKNSPASCAKSSQTANGPRSWRGMTWIFPMRKKVLVVFV